MNWSETGLIYTKSCSHSWLHANCCARSGAGHRRRRRTLPLPRRSPSAIGLRKQLMTVCALKLEHPPRIPGRQRGYSGNRL